MKITPYLRVFGPRAAAGALSLLVSTRSLVIRYKINPQSSSWSNFGTGCPILMVRPILKFTDDTEEDWIYSQRHSDLKKGRPEPINQELEE